MKKITLQVDEENMSTSHGDLAGLDNMELSMAHSDDMTKYVAAILHRQEFREMLQDKEACVKVLRSIDRLRDQLREHIVASGLMPEEEGDAFTVKVVTAPEHQQSGKDDPRHVAFQIDGATMVSCVADAQGQWAVFGVAKQGMELNAPDLMHLIRACGEMQHQLAEAGVRAMVAGLAATDPRNN